MCSQGTEVIVGFKREKGVGPVLMFGMGGVQVEALKDVSFRMAPLSEAGAARMVRQIRSFPLLAGSRELPAADVAAIEKTADRGIANGDGSAGDRGNGSQSGHRVSGRPGR